MRAFSPPSARVVHACVCVWLVFKREREWKREKDGKSSPLIDFFVKTTNEPSLTEMPVTLTVDIHTLFYLFIKLPPKQKEKNNIWFPSLI